MSLDVYLTTEEAHTKERGSGIFIRENGATREVTAEEWNARNPDAEPVVMRDDATETNEVYSGNITHNLGRMAEAAGIYGCLWEPEESGITKASQLIAPLEKGLQKLQESPEVYNALNPENGWGDYEGLVLFVSDYLEACKEYPQADVSVWR